MKGTFLNAAPESSPQPERSALLTEIVKGTDIESLTSALNDSRDVELFLRGLFAGGKEQLASTVSKPSAYPRQNVQLSAVSPRLDHQIEEALGIKFSKEKVEAPADIVIVGAGKMGTMSAARIMEVAKIFDESVRLTHMIDRDPQSLAVAATTLKNSRGANDRLPEFLHSIAELASRDDFLPTRTVAYIVVSDNQHYAVISELAALGIKRFIVEKPIAGSEEDRQRIVALQLSLGLEVIIQEQYLYSQVVGLIRSFLRKNPHLTPFVLINWWGKDRRQDSIGGRNTETGSVFNYDLFHQLVISEFLLGESEIIDSFSRDMLLGENMVIFDHAEGGMLMRHKGMPGAYSVSILDHEHSARVPAAERILNLWVKDADDGKLKLIRANFGCAQYRISDVEIVDSCGLITPLANGPIVDSPLDHSFYYLIDHFTGVCEASSPLERMMQVTGTVRALEERSDLQRLGSEGAGIGAMTDQRLIEQANKCLKSEHPGYNVQSGSVRGAIEFGEVGRVTCIWVLQGMAKANIGGEQIALKVGDQGIVASGDKAAFSGDFSYISISFHENSGDQMPSSMTSWRGLKDVAGGCNIAANCFRRLLLPNAGAETMRGLSAHLVRIESESSQPHFHSRKSGQFEIYVVLDPKEMDLPLLESSPLIDLYSPLVMHDRIIFKKISFDAQPGNLCFIPSGIGHQAHGVYALVIAIPGFLPDNEIIIDPTLLIEAGDTQS